MRNEIVECENGIAVATVMQQQLVPSSKNVPQPPSKKKKTQRRKNGTKEGKEEADVKRGQTTVVSIVGD